MKRAILVGLLLALPAAVPRLYAWAAPTLGQHLACQNSVSTCTIALTGLTNGSVLLLGVSQSASDATNTYTAADGGSNTYTEWATGPVRSTGAAGDRACTFLLATNIVTTAGALTPVVTRATGSGTFRAIAVEILGAATSSATDVQGGVAESANLTSHPMASPGLSTLNDIFMVGVSASGGAHTTYAAATDFTSLTGDFSSTVATAQYLSSSSSRSGETATWTNSANTTDANCLIAIKSSTSAAVSLPTNSLFLLNLGK